MLRPTLGELLRGVRIGLQESVLPALAPGAAERQLKASLHLLQRAERCWDRIASSLRSDGDDIEASLRALIERAGAYGNAARYAVFASRLADSSAPSPADDLYTDPAIAALAAHHAMLQQLLADVDAAIRDDADLPADGSAALRSMLTALYRRMLGRERFQLGLDAPAAPRLPKEAPDSAPAASENTLQMLEVVENALEGVDVIAQQVVVEAEGVISIRLAAANGKALPAWAPGAHIDLIFDGKLERQYSLCGRREDTQHWTVAVLREPESRGGSAWLHGKLRLGDTLRARGPRNNFALEDAPRYIFIAGGVGITPIIAMVREVPRLGKPWTLVYGGRRRASMAFVDELSGYGDAVIFWPQDERGLINLDAVLGTVRDDTAIYCCGPEALIDVVEKKCSRWPEGALHVERFRPRSDLGPAAADCFELVLGKSGRSILVQPDQTIAGALEKIGVIIPTSCGEGTCGTCATRVLEGIPDHRDSFLMGRKRRENKTVMACCSRSLTPRLVVDL